MYTKYKQCSRQKMRRNQCTTYCTVNRRAENTNKHMEYYKQTTIFALVEKKSNKRYKAFLDLAKYFRHRVENRLHF